MHCAFNVYVPGLLYTVTLVTSGTLVPLLQFWSFPSIMFIKIKLTGTVWYVRKINKLLMNIVIISK